MRNPSPVLALALVVLAGCPLIAGPKEDKPEDDAADEAETGERPAAEPNPTSDDGATSGDSGTGTDTGTEMTCEEDLAKVKADLAACEAAKG